MKTTYRVYLDFGCGVREEHSRSASLHLAMGEFGLQIEESIKKYQAQDDAFNYPVYYIQLVKVNGRGKAGWHKLKAGWHKLLSFDFRKQEYVAWNN
jgi:hypothetical protein